MVGHPLSIDDPPLCLKCMVQSRGDFEQKWGRFMEESRIGSGITWLGVTQCGPVSAPTCAQVPFEVRKGHPPTTSLARLGVRQALCSHFDVTPLMVSPSVVSSSLHPLVIPLTIGPSMRSPDVGCISSRLHEVQGVADFVSFTASPPPAPPSKLLPRQATVIGLLSAQSRSRSVVPKL